MNYDHPPITEHKVGKMEDPRVVKTNMIPMKLKSNNLMVGSYRNL